MTLRKMLRVMATAAGGALAAATLVAGTAIAAPAAPQARTHSPVQTFTALTLISSQYTLGEEDQLPMAVGVTAINGATPTGTVTVATGSNVLCTVTLVNGKGTCTLTASQLPLGTYELATTYLGNSQFASSSDVLQQIQVVPPPVPTTTTLTETTNTVAFGNEGADTFTITVAPTSGGGTPTGLVALVINGSIFCRPTLANGTATCNFGSTEVPVGSWNVTANYSGDGTFANSSSAPVPFTVTAS